MFVYPTHGRFSKKEIERQLQSLLASATQKRYSIQNWIVEKRNEITLKQKMNSFVFGSNIFMHGCYLQLYNTFTKSDVQNNYENYFDQFYSGFPEE